MMGYVGRRVSNGDGEHPPEADLIRAAPLEEIPRLWRKFECLYPPMTRPTRNAAVRQRHLRRQALYDAVRDRYQENAQLRGFRL
jgi:hypothetical protein